jgi:hypothetical protein
MHFIRHIKKGFLWPPKRSLNRRVPVCDWITVPYRKYMTSGWTNDWVCPHLMEYFFPFKMNRVLIQWCHIGDLKYVTNDNIRLKRTFTISECKTNLYTRNKIMTILHNYPFRCLTWPPHPCLVTQIINKARWNIVANEGLLYSFIVTCATGCIHPI